MNYKFFPNSLRTFRTTQQLSYLVDETNLCVSFILLFYSSKYLHIYTNTRSSTILNETRTIPKILDDCQETQILHIFWARKSFKSSNTIRPFERKKEGSNKVAMRSQIFPANTNFPCYFWNIVRSEKMKRETIRGNMARLTIADIIFFRLLHRIDLKLVHNIVDPSRFPPLFEDVTWT